jgi:hypothetical protein
MRPPRRAIVLGLTIWFLLAIFAGRAGFERASAPMLAGTVWSLTGALFLLWWRWRPLRQAVDDLPLAALIAIHLGRFVGIYFVILGCRGRLPPGFAFPAGIGDTAVAVGAVAVLFSAGLRRSRPFMLGWNMAGLADIVAVVGSALRYGLRDWHSMAPLRQLPLSVLPLFVVPLIMTSHAWMLVRLWPRNVR